jgi:hypothetical protein
VSTDGGILEDDEVRARVAAGELGRVAFWGQTPVREEWMATLRDRAAGRVRAVPPPEPAGPTPY